MVGPDQHVIATKIRVDARPRKAKVGPGRDVLDTWFLAPFGRSRRLVGEGARFRRYFPTDVLVTAYDIIFFWVARMAFQSKHFLGVRPFRDVLIHGLSARGRKVSKSLVCLEIHDIHARYGMGSLHILKHRGDPEP